MLGLQNVFKENLTCLAATSRKSLKYLYPGESEGAVLCICTLLIKVQVPKARQVLITRAQEISQAFPFGRFNDKKCCSTSSFWLVSYCTVPSLIRVLLSIMDHRLLLTGQLLFIADGRKIGGRQETATASSVGHRHFTAQTWYKRILLFFSFFLFKYKIK